MTESANDDLTTRQRRAVAALLSARDIKAAAAAANVGYNTLRTWLDDPAFVAELRSAEGQAIDAATRRLIDLQGQAIDALAEVLGSGASAAVKVRAAAVVLDGLLRLRELRNIEERLSRLEEHYAQRH